MKHGMGLGLALMVCGVVEAAEPPARAKPPASAPAAAHPAGSAPPPASAAASTRAASATTAPDPPAKPLDLRIGDVRRYMLPREYIAAVHGPDAEENTVVVEGQRELAPMKQVEDVPLGLPSLWYGIKDPKNSWRLLAPAITFKDGPTVDKVPPPIFRWGP